MLVLYLEQYCWGRHRNAFQVEQRERGDVSPEYEQRQDQCVKSTCICVQRGTMVGFRQRLQAQNATCRVFIVLLHILDPAEPKAFDRLNSLQRISLRRQVWTLAQQVHVCTSTLVLGLQGSRRTLLICMQRSTDSEP